VKKDNSKETKASTLHDYPIHEIYATSESLGYVIEEMHLGGEKGPDVIIRNSVNGKGVIVESEIGHNITSATYAKLERELRDYVLSEKSVAVIVITETPRRVWSKKLKSAKPRENFLVVGGSVFKDVMPSLLVKPLE